jgi:hypothetical protein
MQAVENPRPTYCVMGRMGIDLGTFAIDEFDATYAEHIERIRALCWLEKLTIGYVTIMRVS